MLKILVPEISNRLSYTFDLIFPEILNIPYEFVTSEDEFEQYNGPKFAYTPKRVNNGLWIPSTKLLFDTNIDSYNPQVSEWKGLPAFFKTYEEGSVPFDLFACSFYMVSRYEEYQPFEGDKHNRYRCSYSLAYRNGFIKRPVVNLYACKLKELLKQEFPQLNFPKIKHSLRLTIDIDNAYAYQHKGLIRNLGSMFKKLIRFNVTSFFDQLFVSMRLLNDPYNSYEKQWAIQQKYNVRPTYFFLLGDLSDYDRNLNYKNRHFKKLITSVADKATVGIHPSYDSFNDGEKIKEEIDRLEGIINDRVLRSRNHYIRMRIPDTYLQLIECGIKEDYSMGFPSMTGFRAGVCTPFKFFDLQKNECTELKVHPFSIMDTTLKDSQRIRSSKAIDYLRPMIEEIKKVNGEICVILHNESIGGKGRWKKWKNFYENLIKLAIK